MTQKTFYSVFYLLPGKVAEQHLKRRADVCTHFDRDLTVRRDSPAHLTLKYDVEIDSGEVEQLETYLERFCAAEKPSTFRLYGLGHFDTNTIYVDVHPTEEMRATHRRLLDGISVFPWAHMRDFEGMHPHATLMRRIPASLFDNVWSYVQDHHVDEELVFDHVALCPIVEGKRVVQRVFPFMG